MEYKLQRDEILRLEAAYKLASHAQLGWLIRRYMAGTLYPSVADFVLHYIPTAGKPPSPVLAAAYNSGNARLIDMADEVEAIRAAWFPGSKGDRVASCMEAEIKELVDVR
jgi:hypothetical protein